MRVLGISGSLRRDSFNSGLLRAAADLLPPGAELEIFDGLKAIPPYDADDDLDGGARAGARAARRAGGRRRRADRHARVQRVAPGRAQERARLGVAAARHEPAARQARRRGRRLDRHVRRRLGAGGGPQGPVDDRRPRGRRRAARAGGRRAVRRRRRGWSTSRSRSGSARSSPSSSAPPRPARPASPPGPPRTAGRPRPGRSLVAPPGRGLVRSLGERLVGPLRRRLVGPRHAARRLRRLARPVRRPLAEHVGDRRRVGAAARRARAPRRRRVVVGDRVRRLGAVDGAHPQPHGQQRAGGGQRREHAPLDPDRRCSSFGHVGLVEQPPDSSSSAQPPASAIAVPSPPGRWKPFRSLRAQTRNSTPAATSSTAASTKLKTPNALRLRWTNSRDPSGT